MDPDSTSSKDNANPTVLDASALPTRRQRTRQSNKTVENEDEGYGTSRDDDTITRGEGGRKGRSDSSLSNNSSSNSLSSTRNILRRGKARGKGKGNANPFFDGLLAGVSLAGGRGYMDEMLDGSAEEGEEHGVADELDNDNDGMVDVDDDDDDDNNKAEEIDEQEIYGMWSCLFSFIL